jgi:DNA-binding CsgD family transcriptional regulator
MEVLERYESKRITHLLGLLSVRERQLVKYFATGYSNVEVSLVVGIAPTTVKIHRARVYQKFGVASLKDLMSLLDVKPAHLLD